MQPFPKAERGRADVQADLSSNLIFLRLKLKSTKQKSNSWVWVGGNSPVFPVNAIKEFIMFYQNDKKAIPNHCPRKETKKKQHYSWCSSGVCDPLCSACRGGVLRCSLESLQSVKIRFLLYSWYFLAFQTSSVQTVLVSW